METKANYVLIGAFTILTAVLLLLFGLWAAKYSSERSWTEYAVVFNEPVTGLTEGSSVQYNGISVGTVESLRLAPDDPRQVLARLKLQADTPVKVDTKAKMSITGLTGSPFIQLTGGSPRAPWLTAVDHREVPGDHAPRPRRCRTSPTPPTAWSRAWTKCSASRTSSTSPTRSHNIDALTGIHRRTSAKTCAR